jgi:spore maturation protein CgeB
MLKNFEVAASGCVPFCDEIPELRDLGFEDGKTMVSYTNFDELIEKLKYYSKSPELLSQIGKNAATLCAENHTWDHRAKMFEGVIRQYSQLL